MRPSCWPGFSAPYFEDDGTTAYWFQKSYAGLIDGNRQCYLASQPTDTHQQGHTCQCGAGESGEWPICDSGGGDPCDVNPNSLECQSEMCDICIANGGVVCWHGI